jgi:YbgC/YbaW family acyl-CoA thioester hydrolase
MERVKVNIPEIFSFKTKIPIRITDVNYGGHVGNDSFLAMIQEARLQFYKHYGYSEINVEGMGTIMVDVAIEYKLELFYGDEIEISVAPGNIARNGFDLFYLIEKMTETSKQIAAKAKTGILCFDYAARKVVPMPQEAIDKFSNQS